MAKSKQLPGLIGPPLVAIGLNFDIWATNDAPVTYLAGILLLVPVFQLFVRTIFGRAAGRF